MAHYLKHIPCPACGSKDNRAVYSDGSEYCFGCRAYKRGSKVYEPAPPKRAQEWIMADVTKEIPEPNISWLRECLTDDQIGEFFSWSPKLKRHVYAEWDKEDKVVYWEARKVFDKGESTSGWSKVISSGPKPYSIKGQWKETGVLVIVEDIVSAIKLMDLVGVLCLHGSELPWPLYQQIGNMAGIKKVVLWMDIDKFRTAQDFAGRFESWGKETAVIRTPKDPKKYDLNEIKEILKGAIG